MERINRGESPIYERGLDELIRKHVGTRLKATLDARAAVLGSEMTLIAVGTPFDGTRIDLRFVKESAKTIGAGLKDKKPTTPSSSKAPSCRGRPTTWCGRSSRRPRAGARVPTSAWA